ncbi:hypothetical protein ACKFKG_28700 [Phormidesmis sp. 146-35]
MKLLLSNEADCRFFKFWFNDRICDGINYQGELFLQFQTFSAQRRDQAYELGSKLLERGVSVIISCSKKQYVLGVNLRGDWWREGSMEQLLEEMKEVGRDEG